MIQFFRSTIKPSTGLPYTPLLDVYGTNAFCAHSVRKERTAYTGACLRAIRDSDSAEQDIDFDSNGLIDTASLLSFAGAGTVRLKTWYDQTGNGNHLILASALGAVLVLSGVLQANSGMPLVSFPSGNNSYYTMSHAGELNNIASKSLFMACNYPVVNSGFVMGTRGTTTTGWLYRNIVTTTTYQFFISGGAGALASTPSKTVQRYLFNFTHTDAVNGFRLLRDNSVLVTGRPTGGTNRSTYEFGRNSGPEYSVYECFNHIIYSADMVSDESGINTNINDYFACY